MNKTELSTYDTLACAHGMLFNTVAWTGLFGDAIIRYGIFEDGGEMLGGFSFQREKKFGLTILRNPPFTPACGPFLKIKAEKPVAVLEAWREALEQIATLLDQQACALLFLSLNRNVVDALPFYWLKFKVIPHYTYVLDLQPPLGDLGANMAPVRRRNIAKAVKDGLTVRRVSDLNVVKSLVQATFSRQEKPIQNQTLDAILFRFASETNSYAFATYREQTPIACAFVVHDRKVAYYLLGGYRAEEKHHGAGALAMFEAIKEAKARGCQTFDFEGSVIPAIEKYFRGFGGRLTPYFTVNRAWLPLEWLLKLWRRNLF